MSLLSRLNKAEEQLTPEVPPYTITVTIVEAAFDPNDLFNADCAKVFIIEEDGTRRRITNSAG